MSSYRSLSENEDDPDVYESSGEEWVAENKAKNKRRLSQRLNKRPKITNNETSDSDDVDEPPKPKTKNGINKKPRVQAKPREPKFNVKNSDYSNGSFVVLKTDILSGDPTKRPIWKIDGKNLLQKFEPFEADGMICHRTTSIYTGWSTLDREDYTPIKVNLVSQLVQVNWEEVKQLQSDSD